MKTIGLLGGMSWVSTVDYYKFINELTAARLGGTASARVLLHSFDFSEIERHQAQGNWELLGNMLAEAARGLETAGADCILICANTMHLVADAVQAAIAIPVIHIGDATAAAVTAQSLKRVALLGTRYTMEQPFLRERLTANGLDVVIPSAEQRTVIHDIVYGELIKNVFTDDSRAAYVTIMDDLAAAGCEGMILACTEIPLLVKKNHAAHPLFDTAYLHAKAAVDFAFAD